MKKNKIRGPKIAMVVFSYYPEDVRVCREAEALANASMSVDVFCLKYNYESKKEVINGVTIHRLPIQRKRTGRLHYLWRYAYFTFLNFIILSIKHLYKHYALIHVHNMPDILVFSSIIPRLFGCKVILDLHDPMPEVYMTKYSINSSHPIIRFLILLEKLSIRFSNLVITPNISFRDLFISRGCPQEKIKTVMNSPDEKIFSNSLSNNNIKRKNDNEFRIMFHGSIVERHGLDMAARAIKKIHNQIPNVVFHVYGKGEFVESFLKIIKELKLEDTVFYDGYVTHKTIPKKIELIDVGLIPNKRNPFTNINMPTRIFEYLNKGKPVIVPKTKGILDYFNKDSIYYFEPNNEKDLAKVIMDVYFNPRRRREVVKRGVEVYKKHRWELQREYFIGLVAELLGIANSQINPNLLS